MTTFSDRLSAWRAREGYSQDVAGNLLGVTGKYVGMLERGDKQVDEDSTIARLLTMLEQKRDGAPSMIREDPTPVKFATPTTKQDQASDAQRARMQLMMDRIREDTEAMMKSSPDQRSALADLAKTHIDHFVAWLKAASD